MARFNQARRVLKPQSPHNHKALSGSEDIIETSDISDLHDDNDDDAAGLSADGAGGGAPEKPEQPPGGDRHHHHEAQEGAAGQGDHRGDAAAADQDEDVHEPHAAEEPHDGRPGRPSG